MFDNLNSIRFMYIRSHLYALFLTTIILLATLLSIQVLYEPVWLDRVGVFLFVLLYASIGFLIAIYTGFKASSNIKERIDYLSVLITHYANGNFQSRVQFLKKDELTRVGNELNGLGEKLENQVHSLQRMADEKAEYAKQAYHVATMEERQRLARDLHDSVSQQLFALTMISEAALKQLDHSPNTAKDHLKEVIQAGHTAQAEMRALLLHLRPVHLSGMSLPQGIQQLITELQQKCQIRFHVFIEEDLILSEAIEENIFRIIQEALSNIIRHAHATEVKLDIAKRTNELFLHLSDNGTGFELQQDRERKTSYGLKTMRERTEELGGTFAIRSDQEKGTYIDIRIPC